MTPPMARLAVLVILCFPAGRAVAETSVPTSSDAAPAAPAAPFQAPRPERRQSRSPSQTSPG